VSALLALHELCRVAEAALQASGQASGVLEGFKQLALAGADPTRKRRLQESSHQTTQHAESFQI
jgi:hypothetical protein